jgi:hypothetical protein
MNTGLRSATINRSHDWSRDVHECFGRRRLVGRCAIYQTSSRYRHLGATTTGVRRDNNISTEAIGNVLPARPRTYYTYT